MRWTNEFFLISLVPAKNHIDRFPRQILNGALDKQKGLPAGFYGNIEGCVFVRGHQRTSLPMVPWQ